MLPELRVFSEVVDIDRLQLVTLLVRLVSGLCERIWLEVGVQVLLRRYCWSAEWR